MTQKTYFKKIAIVGKIASGKSYFLATLKNLGYHTINLDEYISNLYQKDVNLIALLKNQIGDFLIKNNQISKNILKKWLFEDLKHIDVFEKVLYPYLKQKLQQETYDFIEIPVLNTINEDFSVLFDEVWNLTICPKKRKEFVNLRFGENLEFKKLDRLNNYKWNKNELFRGLKVVNIPMRSRDNTEKIIKILEKLK
ncbi:dephospho-CoA kinase [Mycoplasmopsis mustelae]|uniref:Dephospho-CoA kinase n=1 Tax=Mycoplasmopsis mustelae TaxID=171289 RepID=A0A4R7UEB1_9BACT|nr:dephospho-CoA kinase [Mycoplasmopsis mustelae]TDV23273.1 dephospho-CoA kinase [Mycoplasmopsis mustelae]